MRVQVIEGQVLLKKIELEKRVPELEGQINNLK